MATDNAKARNFSINGLFSSFVLGVFGWGLLHVWAVEVNASVVVHVLLGMPGLVLTGLVLYRYKHHWPDGLTGLAGEKPLKHYRAIASVPVAGVIGLALALLSIKGSFFLLALSTLALVCIPWTRFSGWRFHFFVMALSAELCAALGIVFIGEPSHPLNYAVAASVMLFIASATLLLILTINGDRLDRMPATGYATTPVAHTV